MIVGVPKETYPGERRVALMPSVIPSLTKADIEVAVESGAGVLSGISDGDYKEANARVLSSRAEVFSSADAILQVRTFGANPEGARPISICSAPIRSSPASRSRSPRWMK